LLLVATEPWLAIVWDEGYTLGRETRIRTWLRALRDPAAFANSWQPPEPELVQADRIFHKAPRPDELDTRAKLLDRRALDWFWPFAREEPHGHPPVYAIVGLLGDVVTPWREELPRARLGPMLLFSLVAGALFVFVSRRWGRWPAILAASAWCLQPNLFAHAHYAAYDAVLTSLWIAAILAFAKAVEPGSNSRASTLRWGWIVAFGILAGCTAGTKITGWLLPAPFLAWSALYRDRRSLATLALGGLVAMVIVYAVTPPWWPAPVAGVERFWQSNLSRAKTAPIPVSFLGQVIITPNASLPWYNTLVWTVFVTPVGFLAFALAGIVRAFWRARSEPFGILAVGNWAFFLVLRALPHTPGHDGVRQFLPAFGCLALVAGLGAASAIERFGRLGKIAIVAALVEGATSIALMMPVPLAYYSPLVGGLPGATALGMEPTFYWDALSPEALDWINGHTGPDEKVKFATDPTSWLYLRQTGRLKPNLFLWERGHYVWYVLQNRPGAFWPLDWALVEHGKPAFVVTKFGVPLVWIFPYAEVERLRDENTGAADSRPLSLRERAGVRDDAPSRALRFSALATTLLRRAQTSRWSAQLTHALAVDPPGLRSGLSPASGANHYSRPLSLWVRAGVRYDAPSRASRSIAVITAFLKRAETAFPSPSARRDVPHPAASRPPSPGGRGHADRRTREGLRGQCANVSRNEGGRRILVATSGETRHSTGQEWRPPETRQCHAPPGGRS
jgi:hypothetical protein